MTQNRHILIVEDDVIVSADIESLLQQEGYAIGGVAYDAHEALDILANRKIDIALLDVNLGNGPTGIDIAKIINHKHNIPFIFLTAFSDDQTLIAASDTRPAGYLVKPFNDRSLLTTISLALSNFNQPTESELFIEQFSALTTQEKKIIAAVLEGQSNKQISAQLFVSINTIKYHLKNIYTKCNVTNKQELLAQALKKS